MLSDGITKDEMMETLVARLGDAALPLKQLGKDKLYALEQALNGFEIQTRSKALQEGHNAAILGRPI